MIAQHNLLSIYEPLFQKFCPIQKQKTILKSCQYLVKTTVVVNPIFFKLIFFDTSVMFLEYTIKSILGLSDLQKQ